MESERTTIELCSLAGVVEVLKVKRPTSLWELKEAIKNLGVAPVSEQRLLWDEVELCAETCFEEDLFQDSERPPSDKRCERRVLHPDATGVLRLTFVRRRKEIANLYRFAMHGTWQFGELAAEAIRALPPHAWEDVDAMKLAFAALRNDRNRTLYGLYNFGFFPFADELFPAFFGLAPNDKNFWTVKGVGVGWYVDTDRLHSCHPQRWRRFCEALASKSKETWPELLAGINSCWEMIYAQRVERWLRVLNKPT